MYVCSVYPSEQNQTDAQVYHSASESIRVYFIHFSVCLGISLNMFEKLCDRTYFQTPPLGQDMEQGQF